jgi:hypothetical protein
MFIAKPVLELVFKKIGHSVPEEGKTGKERFSALSRFLACSQIMNKNSSASINLAVGEAARDELYTAVGSVLGLGEPDQFTPNFRHRVSANGYNLGPNFLTTTVKNTRNSERAYPNRPAPLLIISNEKASLHPDWNANLSTRYQFDAIRVPFALWMGRDLDFDAGSKIEDVVQKINGALEDRYGSNVAQALRLNSGEEVNRLVENQTLLVSEKPFLDQLGEVLSETQEGEDSLSEENDLISETVGQNLIIYGAPGTGKSFGIQKRFGHYHIIRTVFHPDMQNSDFFGSLKPSSQGTSIKYAFVPGPFAKALCEAMKNTGEHYVLVIEELNRAPAAAVFGELFQLLDREDDGRSTYKINFPSEESGRWFCEDQNLSINCLFLPNNLSIIATMNSADQGVYPLDTAFRRRWDQEYSPLDFSEAPSGSISFSDRNGSLRTVSWAAFAEGLNSWLIEELHVPEDRLIGPWFVKESELNERIPSKLLLYLWDDLLRHEGREKVFDKVNIRTYGQLDRAMKEGKAIFSDALLDKLLLLAPVDNSKDP